MKKVLAFLTDLSQNNNREWFADNKPTFEDAKEEFELFVANTITAVGKWDKDVLTLSPKDCIYRIYRDVRFSKDKTPYKISFSALINPNGRKAKGAINYLHIQPNASFIAGGMYLPESANLKAIRQEIDYNLSDFEKILDEKEFKSNFGTLSQEWKLKTLPKGYTADNPAIEYLKLKGIVATKNYLDAKVLAANFSTEVAKVFKILQPLNTFLDSAITGEK